jgi:acyl-CoA synthetase (AMP-forming)/AMP-acid ligase II
LGKDRFDAEGTQRLVEKHRATWLYLVPTMMSRIWRLPAAARSAYDLSSLRTVWHLAAPGPVRLKKARIVALPAEAGLAGRGRGRRPGVVHQTPGLRLSCY